MVKLESAVMLMKVQIFVACSLIVLALVFSSFKTTTTLIDCSGDGAHILLLVDVSHQGWHERMHLYSKALLERFSVGKSEQLCGFKKVEYSGSPMDAVDLEFLFSSPQKGIESSGGGVGTRSSQEPPYLPSLETPHTKFLIIFTASQKVLNTQTEATVAKVASLNVTTIVAAFEYEHKVPKEDLVSIASDNFYIFIARKLHANVLIDKIVNVVCRELKASALYNNQTREKGGVTYDCGDANPCSVEILRQEVHTFPYHNPSKFVRCHDVKHCVISECRYGSFWNQSSRICH